MATRRSSARKAGPTQAQNAPALTKGEENKEEFASFFMFHQILKLPRYFLAISLQFEGAWANRHKHDKNGVKNVNVTFVLFYIYSSPAEACHYAF